VTLALVAVLAGSLCFTVHPWYDPTNDGSMYIATARALLRGEGYSYLGVPFLIRPPGFACGIAPVLALRGMDFFALNLWVSVWGALGILLFHLQLRERLGWLLATLVPLLLWFNPGYQRLCNQVMSDVPGWTALVACLLLAARMRPTPQARFWLGIGLGLAALLRSGNFLLVPAQCLAEFCARSRPSSGGWRSSAARCAALVLGALLVTLPWSVRNAWVAPEPPADQTLLYSYSTGMWHTDMGDPRSPRVPLAEVLGRFQKQVGKSIQTLGTRLSEARSTPWTACVAGILFLALLVALVRRRQAEEWFALGTLAVVAFYFGYAGRLLLPVFALAVVALVELVRDGVARLAGPRAGIGAAALLTLGWIALDWHPREGWERIAELHGQYERLAAAARERLAPDARVGAYRGWHHAVFLDRPVVSFEQACARAGGPSALAAIEATVARYGLDTLVLTELGLPEAVQQEERAFAAAVARRYAVAERGFVNLR
jgi:hypothetical protein